MTRRVRLLCDKKLKRSTVLQHIQNKLSQHGAAKELGLARLQFNPLVPSQAGARPTRSPGFTFGRRNVAAHRTMLYT